MPIYVNSEYDIEKAFRAVEDELIHSMIRNLKGHRAEETKEGFNWSAWQTEQLKALEKYKKANSEKFKSRFSNINDSIDDLLREARSAGGTAQEQQILKAIKDGFKAAKAPKQGAEAAFFKLNSRKLNALIKATRQDLEKAEYAMLRMANDKYRQIIFSAQVYANTGAGTYEKAVDMATRDFLSAGINCIEYKNGSRHTVKEYARMAIQTAGKRAYLTGEGEKRKEWGISTVIVKKRGNACPKCLPFCGKVLVDDVWSGGVPDGKHRLMSEAIAAGLYHPNCKDIHTTYFEGITEYGEPYTKEELKQIEEDYKKEQEQQYAKRQTERFERLAKYSLDEGNKKLYAVRKEQWESQTSGRIREANDVTDEYMKKRKPGIGSIVYEEGAKEEDKAIANWLYRSFGGNVKCLKEDSRIGKMPDALWDDIYWEFKAPSSKNSIDERLRKARKQITEALKRDGKEYLKCGIVLDITNRKISLEECIKCIEDRASDRCSNNTDIIIKDKNDVIKILRVKK